MEMGGISAAGSGLLRVKFSFYALSVILNTDLARTIAATAGVSTA